MTKNVRGRKRRDGSQANLVTMDLGGFGRVVMLTGAGWSRNWGAPVAAEVRDRLLAHQSVRTRPALRELLLRNTSFEVALAESHKSPFTSSDREALESAILSEFKEIDSGMERLGESRHPNLYQIQQLVWDLCWVHPSDTGYFFTLNQDLWPERGLYNGHTRPGYPVPRLPGMKLRDLSQHIFDTRVGPFSDNLLMAPCEEEMAKPLPGALNVLKLHGSFNWRSEADGALMVVGDGKHSQIAGSRVLNWYSDIFRAVLHQGKKRLLIVGYGFGDNHINQTIADAIQQAELKIFIWNTSNSIETRVREARGANGASVGETMWSGLLSTSSRPMSEVFTGAMQHPTKEFERIRNTLLSD